MNTGVLIGNEKIKKELEKPFHAYIIEGAHGSGKTLLANLIASASVCVSSADNRPCGKCPSCIKYAAGCNIDVKSIPSDIKTDDLRAELADMSFMPNESEKRCYIIEDADGLSVQTQNILLKVLEEPPEFSVFILTCTVKEKLLETVRSRCLLFTLSPVRTDEIMSFFSSPQYKKYTEEQKRAAAELSEGYIGRAIEFLTGNGEGILSDCGRFIDAALSGAAAEMLKIASFKTREELQTFVKALNVYASAKLRTERNGDITKILFRLADETAKLADETDWNINVKLWNVVLVRRCLSAASER